MNLKSILLIVFLFGLTGVSILVQHRSEEITATGAPPGGVPEPADSELNYSGVYDWARPSGPAKVALQVGHWQNDDFPEELARLRNNDGASAGGVDEVDINLNIANLTKEILEEAGVRVEILPATVPPNYWADAFVSIHADGSLDPSVNGYKFAGPWRDLTRDSDTLVRYLETEYEAATGMIKDPNISRNMRGYYAFAWWKFEHSIHPMTTAVIAETGFVSNPENRRFLTEQPEVSAGAIARGILAYLAEEGLLSS